MSQIAKCAGEKNGALVIIIIVIGKVTTATGSIDSIQVKELMLISNRRYRHIL